MNVVDSSGELLRVLLRLVAISCGSDAAFCYAAARADAPLMPGAMMINDDFSMLSARPAEQIFGDVTISDCMGVVHSKQCRNLFMRLPGAEHFAESYVLYAFEPGRGSSVCCVRYDPPLPLRDSLRAQLMQLAPALAPALTATMALRNEATPALLNQWARRLATLNDACLLFVTQASEARAHYSCAAATAPLENDGLSPMPLDASANSMVLSNREVQIGNLLVTGYAAVNAAAVLGISEHTVRTYIRRLYRKLGVTNRADFVRRYIALVEPAGAVASDVIDGVVGFGERRQIP